MMYASTRIEQTVRERACWLRLNTELSITMQTDRLIQTGGVDRLGAVPLVSIIIPAFNAELTLAETLESVQQQRYRGWEAIVVDDGSSDATVQVGQSIAERDPRIRVLQQPNGGASVARNTGIAQARGVWLLFLDADDIILPDHLANLVAAAEANPRAGASFSSWAYMTPDNRRMAGHPSPESGDLFSGFAYTALFAIHACLVRRDLVQQIGGFDSSLRTCEDWDLWQRVARLGTTFVRCDGETAIYRMRPHSLSRNIEKMLADGLRVVETGFSEDPRVCNPAPAHKFGSTRGNLREMQIYLTVWVASEMLGLGVDARDVFRHIPSVIGASIDPPGLANCIFNAVVLTRCLVPADWPEIWPEVQPNLIAFLDELEARTEAPLLTARTMRLLERRVIEAVASPAPIAIGGTHAMTIEVTAPVEDLHLPCGVERLLLTVTLDAERIGDIELPVLSGPISRHLLADAIAERFSWQILEGFFSRTIYPHLTIQQAGHVLQVRRGDDVLLEQQADEAADLRATLHERLGWAIFLQELWNRPGWLTENFYDPDAADAGSHETIEMAGREWIAVEVSREPPRIVTDRPVQVIPTVAGLAQGAIEVSPSGRAISPQQLRAAISLAGGLDLSRACVREALIGRPLDGPSLRQRLSALAGERHPARQINDDARAPLVAGHVRIDDPAGSAPIYARREPAPSLTATSRLALVPAGTADGLQLVSSVPPETLIGGHSEADGWYVPEIIALAGQSDQRSPAVAAEPVVVLSQVNVRRRPQRSSAAVKAMRRVARKAGLVPPRVESRPAPQAQELVAQPEQAIVNHGLVPALMYHRVAPTGAKNTARYRVAPEAFEEQLASLREAGYQSVGVDELTQAIVTRRPLPGRRVLLTFDDAYIDFAEYAWPLLRRYGFGAILFVVSGLTGRTNEWDRRYGEELPLLGWDALRELRADGVTIGAHSVSHPPLTGLSPRAVAYEAAESRRAIQHELGTPVQAFAYPYGDRDEAVERIVGSCGITLGFTTRSYPMHINDAPLSLPRIEVQGNDNLETFVRNLTV